MGFGLQILEVELYIDQIQYKKNSDNQGSKGSRKKYIESKRVR